MPDSPQSPSEPPRDAGMSPAAKAAWDKFVAEKRSQEPPRPIEIPPPPILRRRPKPANLPPRGWWTQWPAKYEPGLTGVRNAKHRRRNNPSHIPPCGDLYSLHLTDEMFPETGLFPDYIAWAEEITDAARAHHWGALLTGLATCCGPNWTVAHGFDPQSPRFYTLLIGDTGSRKSVALSLLRKLLPEALLDSTIPGSDVALIDKLKSQPWQLWYLNEAGNMLKQLSSKWQATLPQKLCDIFDGEKPKVRSRTAGITTIEGDVFLNMLACTTEGGLLPKTDRRGVYELLEGGLFGRFLLVPAAREREYDLPEAGDDNFSAWLAASFHSILDASGSPRHYKFTEDAIIELRMWQRARGSVAPTKALAGVWNRAAVLVKKIALIYHVSRFKFDEDEIDVDDMLRAIRVVQYYVLPGHRYVADRAVHGKLQAAIEQARELLQKATNGIKYREFARLLNFDGHTRAEVLAAILDDVHFERWKQLPKTPGPSHYVVVLGNDALRKDSRPGEYRCVRDSPPPEGVRRALGEKLEYELQPEDTEPDAMTAEEHLTYIAPEDTQ